MAAFIVLPFDPSHQEVETALNLSAVYETVNVKSINRLSGRTSCAVASWEDDGEEEEEKDRNILSKLEPTSSGAMEIMNFLHIKHINK